LDPTNEHKHEEGTLSSGYSKEWTKTNNLDDDGTQEKLEGRSQLSMYKLTLSVCD
jgi:hypothetical protein